MENNKSSFSIRAGHCSECECVKLYLIISKHSSCFCVLAMTNHCQESTDISIGQCFHPFFLAVPQGWWSLLIKEILLVSWSKFQPLGDSAGLPTVPPKTGFEICCMSYMDYHILLSYLLRFLVTLPYYFQSQLLARDNSVSSEIAL